jgi:hypothetical protein
MAGTKTSGNRTGRRGRKLVQNIHISREHAESLRALLARRRATTPDATEDQLVEELIDREWRAWDTELQRDAEAAWEAGVE